MHTPIYIVGATSTGKSDFAVDLALFLNIHREKETTVILSADSRQVYTELCLLSGKITLPEMKGVPHEMLSITSLSEDPYTVADYQKKALGILEDLHKESKQALICGGTGMYISSLLDKNIYPEIPPNIPLREVLSKKSTLELFEILAAKDPVRAQSIDKHNPVRLVRALEIVSALGCVPPLSTEKKSGTEKSVKKPQILQLVLPDDVLRARIRARILSRIDSGMIEELECILNTGIPKERIRRLGLECRYTLDYIEGLYTKEAYIEILTQKTWQYARRQKTWFRQYTDAVQIDPRDEVQKNEIFKRLSIV